MKHPDKIRKNIEYYKSVNFTAPFVKVHVIANSCKCVTFFAIFINLLIQKSKFCFPTR